MVEACGDHAEVRGDLSSRKQELPLNTVSISSLAPSLSKQTHSTHSHTPMPRLLTLLSFVKQFLMGSSQNCKVSLNPITLEREFIWTKSGDTAVRLMQMLCADSSTKPHKTVTQCPHQKNTNTNSNTKKQPVFKIPSKQPTAMFYSTNLSLTLP